MTIVHVGYAKLTLHAKTDIQNPHTSKFDSRH